MTPPGGSAGSPSGDGILQGGLLAGISAADLAAEFETPLYVYDLDLIARRIETLTAALPRGFRLAFAVKANPALAVLAHIAATGIGADIASAGELEAVLRAGFDPALVAMTGPGKRDEELRAAVAAGVGAVTLESPNELERLDAIAASLGRRQPVLLRLAVSEGSLERVRLISGAEGKFGMPLPVLREAAARAAASPSLELLGLHAFGASNLLDTSRLAGHVAELMDVARQVAEETGTPLRLVDGGGGLGIPYDEGEAPLDLEALGARLAELRAAWDGDEVLRETEILLEPGRWIVGPAGALLLRAVDVKGDPKSPVVVLDGGINSAVRPALVHTEQRLAVLAVDAASRDRVPVTATGPLCTGLDVLARGATLPRPQPGDLVAMLDAGAYGFTESMPLFLSHPTAAEVAVRGGQARLIRPRIAPAELLDLQVIPDW